MEESKFRFFHDYWLILLSQLKSIVECYREIDEKDE